MKTILKENSFAYRLIFDFVKSERNSSIEEYIKEIYEQGESDELAKLFEELDDDAISIADFDEYKMNNYNAYKQYVIDIYNKFVNELQSEFKQLEDYLCNAHRELQEKQNKTKMIISLLEEGIGKGSIETIFRKIMREVGELMDYSDKYWGEFRTWIDEHQAITFYCSYPTRRVIEEVMQDEKFSSIVAFKEA